MKGTRILLVDDEVDFTETLAERLQLRGFVTDLASNGESGIKMVSEKKYDIVILDLKMPGLSGIDTLKGIKALNSGLPVILLTGQGSTKGGEEGMNLGADDYMMKPIRIDELIEKVSKALNK